MSRWWRKPRRRLASTAAWLKHSRNVTASCDHGPVLTAALACFLAGSGVKLGVATNCSEDWGQAAAASVGVPFATIVTAERAGYYKPDPYPYRLALAELDVAPEKLPCSSPDPRL